MRAAVLAAQHSKALARCRHASRTMRLTSARSTDRRAFRLPTVTPKRTFTAPTPITRAAVHATFIDNICRATRIDCSRGAPRTAANSAGVLSRRAEAKSQRSSRAATLNSTAALTRCPLNAHFSRRLPQTPRRCRPLARRAAITARPPRDRMRTKKPCVRARLTFDG